MNISYLLSVLDLYLLNEKEKSLVINILDKENLVKIDFSYNINSPNKTFLKIDKNIFFENINYFLNKIQSNLEIKEEGIDNKIYKVIFDNNRQISFINFTQEELEIIRKSFKTNTEFNFDKINLKKDDNSFNNILEKNIKTQTKFSMGFGTYITIFLTAIWFLDIFMIALWIFKAMR